MGILFKIPVGVTPTYWITTLGGSSYDYAVDVAHASDGVYAVGYIGGEGNALVKLNNLGSVVWQRRLGGEGTVMQSVRVHTDGSVYVVGRTNQQGSGSDDVLVAKYSSSGTLLWQLAVGDSGVNRGVGLSVDSSGNAYVSGDSNGNVLVMKVSASGSTTWRRTLVGTASNDGGGIALGPDSAVYISAQVRDNIGDPYDILLAKYNTDGTEQWQRTIGGGAYEYVAPRVVVDASGAVYVAGSTASQGAGGNDTFVAKFSSTGDIAWQRAIGGTGDDNAYGMAIDASDNIYLVGYFDSQGAGQYDTTVVKLTSAGAVVWQRALGGTYGEFGYGISVNSSGDMYVSGETDAVGNYTNDWFIAKLPSDGSLTGSYGHFTYQATTLTVTTTSLTVATSSLTDTSTSLTDTSTSLTDATTSYTATTITV